MNLIIAKHLPAAFSPGADCPPVESWAMLSVGDLSETRAAELKAHADGCRRCAAEQRLAELFLEQTPAVTDDDIDYIVRRLGSGNAPVAVVPRRRARVAPAVLGLAAAALLVLALVPTVELFEPTIRPPGQSSGVVRGTSIDVIGPTGELDSEPSVLQWHPVSGASGYRVKLGRVDGELLWQGTSSVAQVALPPAIMQRLHPAVVYLWQVEALDADNRPLASSGEISFRVTP